MVASGFFTEWLKIDVLELDKLAEGEWILDIGYWILGIGYWILDAVMAE